MKQHVLITYATRRPYHHVPSLPMGAVYDHMKGYWVKDNKPLALSTSGPVTKKCDHETGEDQKGE